MNKIFQRSSLKIYSFIYLAYQASEIEVDIQDLG